MLAFRFAIMPLYVFVALVAAPSGAHAIFYDEAASVKSRVLLAAGTDAKTIEEGKLGKGAEGFVDTMGQRAIGFLGNPSFSQEQKEVKFRKLLRDSFDMKTIGRFAIGRYWRTATKDQQKEYTTLFENMVVDVYAQRFKDYQGQRFEVRSYRVSSPKDTIVTSYIVPDQGPEVQVDWRVRYKKGQYKIVDVIIEGVSMSLTQRSDFSSVIQRGGGDVKILLAHLRDR